MAPSARLFSCLVVGAAVLLLLFVGISINSKDADPGARLGRDDLIPPRFSRPRRPHVDGGATAAADVRTVTSTDAAPEQATTPPPTRQSYFFDGPLPARAELSLKTGLESGTAIEIKGQLYGALIIEIINAMQDVLLHMNIRSYQHRVVLNEQSGGVWGTEMSIDMPFKADVEAVLVIDVKDEGYKISVDGRALALYAQKHDPHSAMTLSLRNEADQSNAPKTSVARVTVFDAPIKRVVVTSLIKGVADAAVRQAPLSAERKVRLFVGVMSQPGNVVNRFAVRNSWMLDPEVQNGNVAVRFIVGRDGDPDHDQLVDAESEKYNDIFISRFPEGYLKIANKTRVILEIGTKMLQSQFIMKCDDDTYVRIDRLLREADNLPAEGLYWGTVSSGGTPIRDKHSKWYMPPSEWAESVFPPFAHGPGYVVATGLAKMVIQALENNEIQALRLEDVTMGTWVDYVRRKHGAKVNIKNDRRFNIGNCNHGDIIGHYISPQRMVCMWQQVQKQAVQWCC